MVMVDADYLSVRQRVAEFDSRCKKHGLAKRPDSVLVFVPKWRIETWLEYLDGKTVDESKRDYPKLNHQSACAPHVEELFQMCRKKKLRQPAPDSLTAACSEWQRWAASA